MLPISGRSSKTAKKGAARKHLAARSWKLIQNADVNISSSLPTAFASVENLNSLDGDCGAIVDGNPGGRLSLCVAHQAHSCKMSQIWKIGVKRMGKPCVF